MRGGRPRLAVVVALAALVAGSCGSDDRSRAASTTVAPTTAVPTTTEPAVPTTSTTTAPPVTTTPPAPVAPERAPVVVSRPPVDGILLTFDARSDAGSSRPWFRPPFGDVDERLAPDVAAAGWPVVLLWTVASFGWKGMEPAASG